MKVNRLTDSTPCVFLSERVARVEESRFFLTLDSTPPREGGETSGVTHEFQKNKQNRNTFSTKSVTIRRIAQSMRSEKNLQKKGNCAMTQNTITRSAWGVCATVGAVLVAFLLALMLTPERALATTPAGGGTSSDKQVIILSGDNDVTDQSEQGEVSTDVYLKAESVEPTPTPTPDPDPKPDPEPTPEPEPTPDPDPKPDPEPMPDPEPEDNSSTTNTSGSTSTTTSSITNTSDATPVQVVAAASVCALAGAVLVCRARKAGEQ